MQTGLARKRNENPAPALIDILDGGHVEFLLDLDRGSRYTALVRPPVKKPPLNSSLSVVSVWLARLQAIAWSTPFEWRFGRRESMSPETALRLLRSKHRGLTDERPAGIDRESWKIFLSIVKDGQTLAAAGRETGLSTFKLRRALIRVDQALNHTTPAAPRAITLDSPLECLGLSTRARHALRQLGCGTVGSILEMTFPQPIRQFGAGSRLEVAHALRAHGFEPPPSLAENKPAVAVLERDLSRLKLTVEQTSQRWLEQLARLQQTLSKISEE
jgi:hypothetical protein